jgi:hypothetical protein
MALGSGLAQLGGYPFEVRYSDGALVRATAAADAAGEAYAHFSRLFSGVEPNVAVIVADESDWQGPLPYGLPFFDDAAGQIRPGIVVMPAGTGDFWIAIGEDIHDASPGGHRRLLGTYPDGGGGLDLQPFFDLLTIHELGHAFQTLGDLRLPTFWLGEIFANLALHAFVATRQPESLNTLEVLPTAGAQSRRLGARMRAEGYTTLEDLEAHYADGEQPMSPLNYAWYQYRWHRLAAKTFNADGEDGLVRFWECFHGTDRLTAGDVTTTSLASLLSTDVSETLARGIRAWR